MTFPNRCRFGNTRAMRHHGPASARAFAALLVAALAACGTQTASSTVAESEAAESEAATRAPTPRATWEPMPTAGAFRDELVAGLRVETDVPFAEYTDCTGDDCVVPLDILAPEDAQAAPIIVLVPGGPVPFVDRRYIEDLAATLAARGAVVLLTTYRSYETGTYNAEAAPADVRCAVRFARETGAEYGGDPARVVLYGHSNGSQLALEVALRPEADTPGCLATESSIPDAVVASAGFRAALREAQEARPRILLVSGSDDQAALEGPGLAQRLGEIGFEAEYVEFPGIDHGEIRDPAAAPEIVDLILGLVDGS